MSTPPGLLQPSVNSLIPGTSSPAESAKAIADMANQRQATLNASVGGRKRRKYMGGNNSSTVVVPQMPTAYPTTTPPGTTVNDQIRNLSSSGMQSYAWAANDNLAAKQGGGGNPDWNWGCYSGGKKQTKRRRRRQSREKRRTRTRKTKRTKRTRATK